MVDGKKKNVMNAFFGVIKPTTKKKCIALGYVAQYKYICFYFYFNLTLLLTLEKRKEFIIAMK